jgi:hypothetical protein
MIGQGPPDRVLVFSPNRERGYRERTGTIVPENAARKKRARALAQSMGISYTAALRLLNDRPAMASRLLGYGCATGRRASPTRTC